MFLYIFLNGRKAEQLEPSLLSREFVSMTGGVKLRRISFPQGILVLRTKMVKKKKKTIVVGLKSHSWSRELLLRIVTTLIKAGDTVVAVHVQEPGDTLFDPNTFHIYEDLCRHKQVDRYHLQNIYIFLQQTIY